MNIRGLLGAFQQQPDQLQSLLGEYYDPRTAKMKWLGGTLQGLGMGLASGQPGAWATGLAQGGGQAVDDYRKEAQQGYMLSQAKQDQDWQAKERARKESEWAKDDATSAQMQNLLGGIKDPNMRLWAETDPSGYFKAQYGPGEIKVIGGAGYNTKTGDWMVPPVSASSAKPPAGYQWSGEGLSPIPGGPADPRSKPAPKMSGIELKELWKSEDEIPSIDSTIDSLQTALNLNDQTYTGYTAGTRGWLGTSNIPGTGMMFDRNAAEATSEFNKIMSMESIKIMAQTLKGATTDKELNEFVSILGDPTTPPPIRERTIKRMLNLAEKQRQIKTRRIQELKNSPARGGTEPITTDDGYTIQPVE